MKNKEAISLIVEAIDSVKERALLAKNEGDSSKLEELMGDLTVLENCLVTEVKKELNNS